MNINEGNIFEAMRLVLPEHRGVMAEWQRQRSEKKPPVLSADEMDQMQNTLSEAIQYHSKVRLTLFETYGDTVLEGVPVYDGRLRVSRDEGVQTVDVAKLVKVELV